MNKNIALTTQDLSAILSQLDGYLATLQTEWNTKDSTTTSWFWLNTNKLINGTAFIISSLDKMVLFVEDLIPQGQDKKAAVTMVVSKLFDTIVITAMPFWLRPFSSIIKSVVMDSIVSSAIDFVVKKYNEGVWNKDVNNAEKKGFRKQ